VLPVGSTPKIHETAVNNARNYAVVNALDLQALLGQPVGNGNPVPPAVEETIRERAEGKLGGPTPPDVEPAPGSAKPKK